MHNPFTPLPGQQASVLARALPRLPRITSIFHKHLSLTPAILFFIFGIWFSTHGARTCAVHSPCNIQYSPLTFLSDVRHTPFHPSTYVVLLSVLARALPCVNPNFNYMNRRRIHVLILRSPIRNRWTRTKYMQHFCIAQMHKSQHQQEDFPVSTEAMNSDGHVSDVFRSNVLLTPLFCISLVIQEFRMAILYIKSYFKLFSCQQTSILIC